MNEEEKVKTSKKKSSPKKDESKEVKKTTRKKKEEVTDLVVVNDSKPVAKTPVKKTRKKVTKTEEEKALPVPVVEEVKEEKKEEKPEIKEVKVEEVKAEVVKKEPKKEKEKKEPVKIEEIAVPTTPQVTPVPTPVVVPGSVKSEFDGKLLQLIGWYLLGFLVTVVTFGIGKPFAECFILNWQYKHTKINGKRLCFDGNGFQLLGNYIKWTFFTIITLGIYLIFLPVRWNKWVIKHTHYEGNKKPVVNYSLFDGTTWELIGISILSFFLNVFSFGLLKAFTDNFKLSWRINHTTYDNIDMEFDGKGFQLLGNYIKWTFFTIITLGIYGLWVPIKRIKWEVKHTNEKGVSKHPYKPVLGMILPVLFCIVCVGLEGFGASFISKDTWNSVKNDVTHYVTSIVDESEKYDVAHVMAERVSDILYRIKNSNIKISWSERYQRYFERKWYDRLSDNYLPYDFEGEVEMAFLDIEDIDEPVLLVKYEDKYRVYWLYEKKVEDHYYAVDKEGTGLYLATDKDGDSYIAIVDNNGGEFYHLQYIKNTINYDDHDIVYALDMETFNEKLKDKEIKLSNIDIHFTTVDLDDLSGFDALLSYYYSHTEKEYDSTPIEVEDYRDKYMNYLKDNFKTGSTVYVIDDIFLSDEVLVVVGKDKTVVLSYNDELVVTEHIQSPLKVLRDSNNKDYYVLITNESKYIVYDFVDSMIGDVESYTGTKQIRVKSTDAYRELKARGYREVSKTIYHVILTNENDLELVSKKLYKEETTEEPKEEEKKEEVKKGIKVDKYVLEYGDYNSDLKGIYGGTYTLLEDGSYIYINPDALKDGKKYTLKETGKYETSLSSDKKATICMKGNNKNNTCYEVDKDNHFKDYLHSVNYEFEE